MSADSHKRRRADDGGASAANVSAANAGAAPSSVAAASADGSATHAEKKVKIEEAATAAGAASTAAAAATPAAAAAGKKKRRWDTDGDGAASAAASASPAASSVAASSTPTQSASASSANLTPAQKALALQKSIAERLAAAKIPKVAPSASPAVSAAAVAAALASVAPPVKREGGVPASTAAALSASGLNPLQFLSPSVTVKDEKSWVPLRLDSSGRAVDAEGRVLQVERHTDLRINQKAKEDALAAAKAAQHKLPHAKIATTILKEEGMSKFHDPRMPESKPVERKPRGLVLVKPGKYIQQAATMRMKQLEKDLKDAAKLESKSAAASAAAAAPVAVEIVRPAAIPSVEWWDAKLLRDPLGLGYASEPNLDRVGTYIYHPVEVSSLVAAAPPPPMPVLLTKKERKKIKKRNKRELLKEKQDRVRLGLEAPAEPKMRIQNLMNALLNDTVADPSAMEAKVRAQMAERVEAHETANAQAKLTSEQKAEKRRRKFAEDLTSALSVCVYRAGELGDTAGGKARYQLSVNTEQWNLSGVAVLHPDCNVVVVEGGPKSQRRFRRLMIHRIKWRRKQKNAMEKAAAAGLGAEGEAADAGAEDEEEDDSDSSDDEEDEAASSDNAATVSRTGACVLVWSGVVPKARFPPGRFVFEACRSEVLARNFLKAKGMESYWDMCRAIPQNAKQQQVEL